jgi:SAM-dependent methyltransferase
MPVEKSLLIFWSSLTLVVRRVIRLFTEPLALLKGLGNPEVDVIDLGMHPYADTFIPAERFNAYEEVYPLICVLDAQTGYIHNKYETNVFQRYNEYDYSYTSDNSQTAIVHWREFSSKISNFGIERKSVVLEIGSNDGYLCSLLMEEFPNTYGVDTSEFMSGLASNRGVKTLTYTFSSDSAQLILEKTGPAKVVIANNVLNHANDPLDFLKGIVQVMDKEGIFIFEVPYWLNQFVNKRFDMIYHEHVSYFTVKSLTHMFSLVGLKMLEVDVVNFHGGSLRITACKAISGLAETPLVKQFIDKEYSAGLFDSIQYAKFMQDISAHRSQLLEKLYHLHQVEENFSLFGIGASAKGNTFLNYYGLNGTFMKAVTDASQFKIGKFTPVTRLPILDDKVIATVEKPYVLTLSWNIGAELRRKLLAINPNTEFLEL